MKKTTLVLSALSLAFAANAQRQGDAGLPKAESVRTMMDPTERVQTLRPAVINSGAENIIWSEDFANGIPATWQNIDALSSGSGLWEYRGATGNQPATVGSRGAYANAATIITSATAANGFVIFDSDYLDNNGIAGNFGGGVAPSPHQSLLVTDVIDLSSETNVDLTFTQYYRRFAGPGGSQAVVATYVDLSTDGGVTWPHTLTYNTGVSVNAATGLGDVQARDVTALVAGQSNVKIRFRFDGDYYFWMVDDIQLSSVPKFRLEFTALPNGAPIFDLLYGPDAGLSGRYGQMSSDQKDRDITFDCNAISTGTNPVYNAKLQMVILRNGSPLTTIDGPTYSSPWGGAGLINDTLTYDELNTTAAPFRTNGLGTYEYFYRVIADTNMAGTGSPISIQSDTSQIIQTDSTLALDAGLGFNAIGSTEWGESGAFAVRMDLVNGPSTTNAFGFSVRLANTATRPTVPGGFMVLDVYDSSSFIDFTAGFDINNQLYSTQKTVTQADVTAGFIRFNLTSMPALQRTATNNSYFFVVSLFSNQGANPIHIINDQSFPQSGAAKMMYITDQGRWFTGYSNSRGFNSPLARLHLHPSIGLSEINAADVNLYPNPTNGVLNITMDKDFGVFDVRILDISGREVSRSSFESTFGSASTIDMSGLNRGLYFVEIANDSRRGTFKVSVE